MQFPYSRRRPSNSSIHHVEFLEDNSAQGSSSTPPINSHTRDMEFFERSSIYGSGSMPPPISIMPSPSSSPKRKSVYTPRRNSRVRHINLIGFYCQPGDPEYRAAAKATGIRDNRPIYWFAEYEHKEDGYSEEVMEFDPCFSTTREKYENQMVHSNQDITAQRNAVSDNANEEVVQERKDAMACFMRDIAAVRDAVTGEARSEAVEAKGRVLERTDDDELGEESERQEAVDTRTEWEELYETTVEQFKCEEETDANKGKGKAKEEVVLEDDMNAWQRDFEESAERLEQSLHGQGEESERKTSEDTQTVWEKEFEETVERVKRSLELRSALSSYAESGTGL